MSQYDTIDRLIVEAIRRGSSPLYDKIVTTEAIRLEGETGREDFRIIDGRLTALKKSGRIAFQRWGDERVKRWGVVAEQGDHHA